MLLVEKARDPYLDRDALKISVFMNVFNVHSNRSPVSGIVKQRWYHAGKYFNASLDKSSDENERLALWIQYRGRDRRRVRADRWPGGAPHPLLCQCR